MTVCVASREVTKMSKRRELPVDHKIFIDLYSKLVEDDTVRVAKFEETILQSRKLDVHESKLRLIITLDGIKPVVKREMIVSIDLSLHQLHHQVLGPAMGWARNYHSYAFRRIHCTTEKLKSLCIGEGDKLDDTISDSVEMMSRECWIGPQRTTAIDNMFQPLYIGGAVANDKVITLRDLFGSGDKMYLQYGE